MLGPAEKELMQTEPVQVIVLILAGAPKTTPPPLFLKTRQSSKDFFKNDALKNTDLT